jgi:hypothetical protein
VHLVDSHPGLVAPNSTKVVSDAWRNLPLSNNDVDITYPLLTPGEKTFTTRITLKSKLYPTTNNPLNSNKYHLVELQSNVGSTNTLARSRSRSLKTSKLGLIGRQVGLKLLLVFCFLRPTIRHLETLPPSSKINGMGRVHGVCLISISATSHKWHLSNTQLPKIHG